MARRVQLLGALALIVAAFLPWSTAQVLGVHLGLPGIFLHGSIGLALGLLLAVANLLGLRAPGLALLAALASASFTLRDLSWILERTEYALKRLQLSLADLNHVLGQLNLQPIELYTREASPWAHVGPGVWVALAGAGCLALGALAEAGRAPGKKSLSVLIGLPRCRQCDHRVDWSMSFCPGCGTGQGAASLACPCCQRPLKAGFKFCPDCGHRLLRGEGEGKSMMGAALV